MLNDIKLVRSHEEDMVSDLYHIKVKEPIRDLSNDFVTYYKAENLGNDKTFFAIVFSNAWTPVRYLETLELCESKNIIKPVSYGLTKLSHTNSYHLVAIVPEYDYHSTLENFIRKNEVTLNEVEDRLLRPFIELLQFCNNHRLSCGNINTKNILVINNKFVLREPFISPSSHYQDFLYLSNELLHCHRIGRETKDASADLFALGITLYLTQNGYKSLDEQYYRANFMKYGTIQTLVNMYGKSSIKEDENIGRVISVALSPNVEHRMSLIYWDCSKLFFPKEVNHSHSEAAVVFNGERYNQLEYLLTAMFNNWDVANHFVNDDMFVKSLKNFRISNEIYEVVHTIITNDKTSKRFNSFVDQHKLTKILQILSHSAVFQVKGFSMFIEAIPDVISYALLEHKDTELAKIDMCLKDKLYSYFSYNTLRSIEDISEKLNSLSHKISNSFFPFERLMYTLNPYMPCLSKLIENQYVVTVPELLSTLENLAASSSDRIFWDEHIVAFLAAKLNCNHKEELSNIFYEDFSFTKEHGFFMLLLIAKAQKLYPNISMVNLCNYIAEQASVLVTDEVYNSNLRKVIAGQIIQAGEEQNLAYIIELISNQKVYKNDKIGYAKAKAEVRKLTLEIEDIEDTNMANSIFWGQKVTVVISYVLCLMISIGLML